MIGRVSDEVIVLTNVNRLRLGSYPLHLLQLNVLWFAMMSSLRDPPRAAVGFATPSSSMTRAGGPTYRRDWAETIEPV